MRRLAALVVLGAVVTGTAGCSGDAASPDGVLPTPAADGAGASARVDPSGAASAAAASAGAALGGNTTAICEQAARTGSSFGETFIADLRLQIDAAAKGAEAKTQADQKVARDVQNYSYALADMAELTTDARLKKAL